MAKFDKTFPTLDCAACILTPKMSEVGAHQNITLWTYRRSRRWTATWATITVTIKRKPRYVNEDLCTGCQECIANCVYKEPKFTDEFNEGLGKRKPVYIPFPQATPQVVLIDPEVCLNFKRGVLTDKCKKTCVEACGEKKAIDFNQKEETQGDQGRHDHRGHRLPDVRRRAHPPVRLRALSQRLLPRWKSSASSTPPARPAARSSCATASAPKAIGIIHCVGSRDQKTNRWCSRVCCMYSLKLAHLLKEHTEAEVYNFYIDMRTPGKGYEEFYDKLLDEGVHFIRGRVGEVTDWAITPEEEGKLVIRVEDTLAGVVRRIPVDMVVLATGLEPQADAQDVRRLFNMSCGSEGFFLERHPKLAPVNTFTDGIFIAGCLPGTARHSRHGRPGRGGRRRGAGPDRQGLHRAGAQYRLHPRRRLLRLQVVPAACARTPPSPSTRRTKKAVINEALCKGCGTCVGCLPVGVDRAEPVRGRGGLQRNRRSPGL